MQKAKVSEIFKSIQGEGLYVGSLQIFIRFYGCNLNCKFCDTKLNSFSEYRPEDLFKKILPLNRDTNFLSLTGGEPLLHSDFLKEFLPSLKKEGFKICLETNATLSKELEKIIEFVDVISADIKLPSSAQLKDLWSEHKDFLKIAFKKELFVKSVICKSTIQEDLEKAVKLIREIDKEIPFILQPNSFEIDKILIEKILNFYKIAKRFLKEVRIIPQVHRFLKCR